MATADDNRGRRRTSRDRGKQRQTGPATTPVAPRARAKSATQPLIRELEAIEEHLHVARATCVTAQLALEGTGGESARAVARALEVGAGAALSIECHRLNTVIVHLMRGAPLPAPRCSP
jgi:hypothetical protein